MKDKPIFNLKTIKEQANQSIENGSVTADYPLDKERACLLLNSALASEIMCVLRYRHHYVIAKGIDRPQVADEFLEHSQDEERHMMMLAERINQLGGDPNFNPEMVAKHSPTDYGKGEELDQLIKEDLVAERIAVMLYRKLIEWFGTEDSTTRRMLEKILEDEEEHASDLADLLG